MVFLYLRLAFGRLAGPKGLSRRSTEVADSAN